MALELQSLLFGCNLTDKQNHRGINNWIGMLVGRLLLDTVLRRKKFGIPRRVATDGKCGAIFGERARRRGARNERRLFSKSWSVVGIKRGRRVRLTFQFFFFSRLVRECPDDCFPSSFCQFLGLTV